MSYIKGLDSLRAIAALLVLLHHFGPVANESDPNFFFHTLLPDGAFGVDLFFVLSGFLITGVLLEAKGQGTNGTIIKNFIVRRALRLFPIYYLLLLFLFFINFPDIRSGIFYYATYTSNFLSLFTQSWNNFSHSWTLSVEEQFYLLWPWIIILSPRKYLLHIILFFIQLGIVSSIITSYQFSPFFTRHFGFFSSIFTINCFHAFAIGALFALSRTDERIKKIVPAVFLYLLPATIVLYVLNRAEDYTHFNINALVRLINSLISINLIIYVVKQNYSRFTASILHNKVLLQLGKISYGIYLYHYVIGVALTDRFDPRFNPDSIFTSQYLYSAFVIGTTIAAAFISYYGIEKHFLKLKVYFSNSKIPLPIKSPGNSLGQQPVRQKHFNKNEALAGPE